MNAIHRIAILLFVIGFPLAITSCSDLRRAKPPVAEYACFSPDGEYLVYSSYTDKKDPSLLRVCDGKTGRLKHILRDRKSGIHGLSFSANGDLLASGGGLGQVLIWDTKTWRVRKEITLGDTCGPVVFSPDNKLLAIAQWFSDPRNILIYHAPEFTTFVELPDVAHVKSMAFSADSKFLATAGRDDPNVRIWDVASLKLHAKVPCAQPNPNALRVNSIAFSPDGNLLATGGSQGILQIWKTGEWKELFQLKGHTQGVYSLAFGDGGKVLLSASDCNPQNEKEAILWDLRTRKEIARFSSESAGPLVAAFCPKTGIFTTGLTQAGDSMGVFRLSDYTK